MTCEATLLQLTTKQKWISLKYRCKSDLNTMISERCLLEVSSMLIIHCNKSSLALPTLALKFSHLDCWPNDYMYSTHSQICIAGKATGVQCYVKEAGNECCSAVFLTY